MESADRKKVESTIAQSLVDRIKKAEDYDAAAPDLIQLRQLVVVNQSLKKHVRNALSFLIDAEFIDEDMTAEFQKEWEDLGGNREVSQTIGADQIEKPVARTNGRQRKADTPFAQLLREPADVYSRDPAAPWTKIDGDELEGFLDQIDPIDGNHVADPATTQVAWSHLPFYEKVALIRVVDQTWSTPNLAVYYLTDGGNLFRLNGTSPPLHEVNAKAPIVINEENVLDYLRFFCFFVRGEEGPFYVAENIDDPYMPVMSDQTARTVIEGTVRPATFEGMDDKGNYLCDCLVFYSNAMFIANFSVQPTGMIEMLDDEPIAADLPVRINAPLT